MTPDQAIEKVMRFQPRVGDVFVLAVSEDVPRRELADLAKRLSEIVEPTGATGAVVQASHIEAFVSSQSAFDTFAEWLATVQEVL